MLATQPMFEHLQRNVRFPASNEPLRLAVRRLRWFKAAFHACMDSFGQELGCRFVVDDVKLAKAFVRWLQSIDQQRPARRDQRRAFFEFAPALMLKELVADMPVHAATPPTKPAADEAAVFWPEGFVCTLFCLSIYTEVAQQEFGDRIEVNKAIDLRSWWSFRENVSEDGRFAAGFFQKLLGHDPNWMMPEAFVRRPY